MPTYFVLATKRVELRGEIWAKDREHAIERIKAEWQIYDHHCENAVCAGTASANKGKPPIISEYDDHIKILYLEDTKHICKKCGQRLRNHNKDGSCRIDKFTTFRGENGSVYRKSSRLRGKKR